MSKTLLDRIEAYLVRHAMHPSHFSRAVARDSGLVQEMRRGRKIGEVLTRKIEAAIAPPKKHRHRKVRRRPTHPSLNA